MILDNEYYTFDTKDIFTKLTKDDCEKFINKKGYFGDTLEDLEENITLNDLRELRAIGDYFHSERKHNKVCFNLFILHEKITFKKNVRPYKNCEEFYKETGFKDLDLIYIKEPHIDNDELKKDQYVITKSYLLGNYKIFEKTDSDKDVIIREGINIFAHWLSFNKLFLYKYEYSKNGIKWSKFETLANETAESTLSSAPKQEDVIDKFNVSEGMLGESANAENVNYDSVTSEDLLKILTEEKKNSNDSSNEHEEDTVLTNKNNCNNIQNQDDVNLADENLILSEKKSKDRRIRKLPLIMTIVLLTFLISSIYFFYTEESNTKNINIETKLDPIGEDSVLKEIDETIRLKEIRELKKGLNLLNLH